MTKFQVFSDAREGTKTENRTSDPFPPSYYESKKRAQVLIDQMSNPKWMRK